MATVETTEVVVTGTLKPDGTLELDESPDLPPGRVRIGLRVLKAPAKNEAGEEDPFLAGLERISAKRRARGAKPRTVEEIDAEIKAFRDEWEERFDQLERARRGEDARAGQ